MAKMVILRVFLYTVFWFKEYKYLYMITFSQKAYYESHSFARSDSGDVINT